MGDECNPCIKVIVGIVLFFATIAMIGWNEGTTLANDCKLSEMQTILHKGDCNADAGNDGKLVYISCPLKEGTGKTFTAGGDWGADVKGTGIKFDMTVQTYMVTEKENCPPTSAPTRAPTTRQSGRRLQQAPSPNARRLQAGCTYTYTKEWRKPGTTITFKNPNWQTDSSQEFNGFRKTNPDNDGKQWNEASIDKEATSVEIGTGYSLLVKDMGSSDKKSDRLTVPTDFSLGTFESWKGSPNGPVKLVVEGGKTNMVWNGNEKQFQTWATAATPQVGDVRVYFEVTTPKPQTYAYVGQQVKASDSELRQFGTYKFTKCDAQESSHMYSGVAVDAVKTRYLENVESKNSFLSIFFRILGFLGMWLAFWLLVSPLEAMGDAIGTVPCVGDMIEGLVDTLLLAFTCLCGTIWFLLIFAACWMYYRPMIGIPIFVVVILLIGGVIYWRMQEKKKRQAAAVPAPAAAAPGAVVIPVQPGVPAPVPQPGFPAPAPAQPGFPAPAPAQPGFPAPAPAQPGFPAPAPQPGFPAPAPIPVTPEDKVFNSIQGKSGAQPGQVAWNEFKNLCTSVGWQESDALNMWYATDTDKNNVLGQAEFLAFARNPSVAPHIANMANSLP